MKNKAFFLLLSLILHKYSYDVGYIFLYDVIYATIFGNRPNFSLFCIPQSNSTLTSSYLCTPSIFLYQVQRECARTLTIVAALLYNIKIVGEYSMQLVCFQDLYIENINEKLRKYCWKRVL